MVKSSILLFVALGLFVDELPAQNQRAVDSLYDVLDGRSGAARFPALYDLVFEYRQYDLLRALKLAEEAREAAELSGDSLWILKSIRVEGSLLFQLGQITQAISICLPVADRTSLVRYDDEYFTVVNLLGVCHTFISQFDRSLGYHFQALEIARASNNANNVAIGLTNIGLVYYKLKDYAKALDYFAQGQTVKDSLGIQDFASSINMSLCYVHLLDFKNARAALDESIKGCGDLCPPGNLIHIKYASGCANFRMGNYQEAERDFSASLIQSRSVGDARLELDNICMLARIYIGQHRLQKAARVLRSGERVIRSGTPFNMEMIKVYGQLSELFLSLNDFERAAYYQSKYIHLKDSIYNETVTTSLMRVEAEHIERKSGRTIAAQQQLLKLKDDLLQRQERLNVLSCLVVVLASVAIWSLVKHYRKKQALNALLDERVRDRTRELELSRKELSSSLKQQDLMVRRALSGIAEHISTVKGLCSVAQEDTHDSKASLYFEKIEKASRQIEGYLKSTTRHDVLSHHR